MQLDGEIAVLGQIDGRRVIERGKRTVQSVDVALGQAHHFPDVLQLVAQRGDLLEVERHDDAATAAAGSGFGFQAAGGSCRGLGIGG